MLLGWIPGPASKTIYYGHVTSLQLGPLLPLEIYELLMNARDMHEKVSSFQRTAIVNENNINSAQREEKTKEVHVCWWLGQMFIRFLCGYL